MTETSRELSIIAYYLSEYDMKAVKELDDSHRSQLYNYLKATGFKLGFLINFGKYDELQIERRVL